MSENLLYRKGFSNYPDFIEVSRLGRSAGITMYNHTLVWVGDKDDITDSKEYTTEVQLVDNTSEQKTFRVYLLDDNFSRYVLCEFFIDMEDVDEMYKRMTDEGYAVTLNDILEDHYTTILHSTIVMYLARCTYQWAMYLYYNHIQTRQLVKEKLEILAEESKKPTIH